MELDEDLYKTLHDDLDICREYIRQVAISMIRNTVSNYPIFIAWRGENDIDLGLPMVKREDFDISFSFNVSHLEDFVNKGLIDKDKAYVFMKTYKNPAQHMCIFLAEEGAMSFVFMPYQRPHEKQEELN